MPVQEGSAPAHDGRPLRVLGAGDLDQVAHWASTGEFCWLDLECPDDETVRKVGDDLGLHPLAIEDTTEFEQRPKADVHGDQLLLVYFGAVGGEDAGIRLVEVHVHISNRFVLTVHREPFPKLTDLHRAVRADPPDARQTLVYRILDVLTDSLLDVLDDVAAEVSEQESLVFRRPRARDRDRMAQTRRSLDVSRRTVATQRQVFDRMVERLDYLPGLTRDLRANYADVSDHLWRAVDDMESARDSLQGMIEQYSNAVQERLTIVATIFLPLTLVTGFFGQNFNWMINHIGATWAFWGLGVGGLIVSAMGIWLWLIRTGMYDRRRRD